MLIYVVLLFTYIVLAIFNHYPRTKKGRFFYVFALLSPLFVLVAFRSVNVGADTFAYSYAYEKIEGMTSLNDAFSGTYMEKGYVLLEYVSFKIGIKFYLFQFLITCFYFVSLGFFFYKNSRNVGLSCFFFLTMQGFFGMMNQTRMWIAISILLFCYETLKHKKYLLSILLILLSATVHTSALVFLIVPPLIYAYNKKKNLTIVIGVSVAAIVAVFGQQFYGFVYQYLDRYSSYSDSSFFRVGLASVLFTAEYLLAFVLINKNNTTLALDTTYRSVSSLPVAVSEKVTLPQVETIAFITLIVSIAGLQNAIMTRVISFFSVFLYAFLSNCFVSKTGKIKNWLLFTLIVAFFSFQFFYIMIYRSVWDRVIPYEFYF